MKQVILKLTILALYISTLLMVFTLSDLLGGFILPVVLFVLAYCGIIVLAHLISTLNTLCHWCVAASRERRTQNFTAPPVAFETETEAT